MERRAYEAERRRLLRRRVAVGGAVAVVVVPLFGIVDYIIYRDQFAPLMSARLLSALLSGIVLLLIRGRIGKHRPSWLAFALIVQCGLAIGVVPAYVTGVTNTPHYVSLAMVILTAAALLPWSAFETILLTTVLVCAFAVAGWFHGGLHAVAFGVQSSAILGIGSLAVVITILNEQMRVREFAARRELRRASGEKTRLINRLETLAARLATANEDLQERQRETEDFVYVLSHDLRAPLINIQGFGKRLHNDMSALEATAAAAITGDAPRLFGRMKQSLQFLNAGTAKIDQLITRLLDIARLTTKPGRYQWVDSMLTVREVIDACRFQIEAAAIEITLSALPTVRADPVQLNQVFTNLIDNAVKYIADGPRKQIAVSCLAEVDRYRFAIADTGPGIDPKDAEKIFRLFARLAPHASRGEGIGLAAVRAIINQHGGRVWVEPNPGGGSTFYFTLPRHDDVVTTNGKDSSLAGVVGRTRLEEQPSHV